MLTTKDYMWAMDFIAKETENFSRSRNFSKREDVDMLHAIFLNDIMKLGFVNHRDEEQAPPQILFALRLLYTAWCADETPDGDHKRQAAKAAYEKLRQEFRAGLEKALTV